MDPPSATTRALGTLGVLIENTQGLITLVSDVKGAPEEVLSTEKTAKAFVLALHNIRDQVENGQIPSAIAGTFDYSLTSFSTDIEKLTLRLQPHIEVGDTGRKWRSMVGFMTRLNKKDVGETLGRLQSNINTLHFGLASFGLAHQAGGLSAQISSVENITKEQHIIASETAARLNNGVETLSNLVSSEIVAQIDKLNLTHSGDIKDAGIGVYGTPIVSGNLTIGHTYNYFTQGQPDDTSKGEFVASMGNDNEEQHPSKLDQIRDLMIQMRHDPVDALQTFFENSTIIETNNTKHDIANLETLEEDYRIFEEPEDFSQSLEERIEEYGGMDDINTTLLRAVMAGDKDVTTAMLDADANVDARDEARRTPLMLAASDDHKLITQILLKHKASINIADEKGLTALHLACTHGFHGICAILISAGANIEAKTIEGDTPLRVALKADKAHIMELLIESNCSSKTSGPDGKSILHLAVEKAPSQGLRLLRVLLESGVDPNLKDSSSGQTALHLAAAKGSCDCIELLLKWTKNIDTLDDKLDSALLLAARADNGDAIKMLVTAGADINLKSSEGMTALSEAAKRHKSAETVKTLLELHANVETRSPMNQTPLHIAAQSGNTEVLELLIKVADLQAVQDKNYTAMHLVAWNGFSKAAKLLLDGGVEPNAMDKFGRLPLHLAACNSKVNVLSLFLDQGIDIESPGRDGRTALHWAAEKANLATNVFLLDRKANIEACVATGINETPLLRAVLHNKLDIVKLLLDNNANISAKGPAQGSALHICAWKGFEEMTILLLKNGAAVDIESLDKVGRTPLLQAATYAHEAVAQILIYHGANLQAKRRLGDNVFRIFCQKGIKSLLLFNRLAEAETDINIVNEGGFAPILQLAYDGQSQIIAAAIDKGADIHAQNTHGLTPLNHASWRGFKDVVILLLNSGADINHKDNQGRTPLLHAAGHGHVEILKVLIARGADLTVKNAKGQNALEIASAAKHKAAVVLLLTLEIFKQDLSTIHDAVRSEDLVKIEILLSNNPALLNDRDEKGNTPLHTALHAGGKYPVVELLLRKNADLTAQDSMEGRTPLMLAAGKEQTHAVVKILEKNSDMSLKASNNWTALHYAAKSNINRSVVKLLVEHGFSINDRETVLGSTPLHLAAAFGRLDVVRFFLESGADKDIGDHIKITPLQSALRFNHMSTAELLIEKGADISNKLNSFQMSAISHCATWTNNVDLMKLLLDRGAILEDPCSEGFTPLSRAAMDGKDDVFHFLLEKGANVDSLDNNGQTTLHRASRLSRPKVVKLLLGAKASPNMKEKNFDMTPLHYAAINNNSTEISQLLIDSGAELDSKDFKGYTPIFKAVFQNKINVLKYLVKHGADTSAIDNEGFNVLHRAVKSENKQAITVLLELGANIQAKTTELGLSVLHLAAMSNNEGDVVRELLGKGIHIEEKDNDGHTALLRAAINGKTAVMKVLLENGAEKEVWSINSRSTPLLRAISGAYASAAQCLIENGADLTARTHYGWQAIHDAVRFELKPVISSLIDRGQLEATVDQPSSHNMHGFRPLHVAVKETVNEDIVRLLVARGGDIKARTLISLQTPFLCISLSRTAAPAKTDTDMVAMAKLLMSLGADVRATDKSGENLLFGAARQCAMKLFEFLLEQGLDIDSEGKVGVTVLHAAAVNGKTETVKYLLEKGANKLHQSKAGTTPLHAAVNSGHFEVVKLLATLRGEELDIQNNAKKTPLDLARIAMSAQRTEATIELREKAEKNAREIFDYLFQLECPYSD